jgi:hypothetical protein
MKKGIQYSGLITLLCFLGACSVKPTPISIDDRYAQAQKDTRIIYPPKKHSSQN